ncbi:hypothetical protein QBC46DRAFT_323974 [Diplogelasinospora grovesii]|uniref:Uncharacterized protein n=1 Tax=Diplogelasinospora grovesii TaxID=303347 RepID=A0AAN6MY48_9PEZI|nr:hypothetical protein QBC46DRAFT_323974 [Diplogelasinospora grovesii]
MGALTYQSLDDAIDHFLQTMKSGFPCVKLTRTDGEATRRYKVEPPFQSLREFKPLDAGELQIQYKNVANMTQTENQQWIKTWVFRMALTIAHELTHFFTGYKTGDARPITPPNVSVPGWEGGEAGRAWEVATFGGIVEFWSDGNDLNQPGEPIIFADLGRDTEGRPVSARYVEAFAGGSKSRERETGKESPRAPLL